MAHNHSVTDKDTHFVIDGDTRAVKNANATKTVLIQGDHNSERFTFEIPNSDGHDMSKCNVAQVHYINISETGEENPGVYEIDDLKQGADSTVCSWLISGNATKYVGMLAFVVHFACVDDEGKVVYAWNTSRHEKVHVLASINNGEYIEQEYPDILAQWEARISDLEKGNVSDERIAEAVQDYLDENPVSPGATPDEVNQIHENAAAIAELQKKATSARGVRSGHTITLTFPLEGGGQDVLVVTVDSNDLPTNVNVNGVDKPVVLEGF